MLNPKLIPTALMDSSSRGEVIIRPLTRPVRFRSIHIFFHFVRFVGLGIWARFRGERARQHFAIRLRHFLERMGGMWIKVGQLLALRRDIFSSEFCAEMGKLHGSAEGFPPEVAKRIIEEELGPIGLFFDHFEDKPYAAASIGQMHLAHLRHEQVWVAVKVQRPFAAEMFAQDLQLIGYAVRLFRSFNIMTYLRWDEMLWELQQMMIEEVDYRREASALSRMRESLKKHRIYVHHVFYRYSTARVLVTEFVHGVLMADFIKVCNTAPEKVAAWCAENNIDPHLVARRLYLSQLRQTFEDNLFHGDLHPGNIMLLRNSRIGFIDFGTVGSMERDFQKKLFLFVQSVAMREYSKAVDVLFLLTGTLPVIDLEEVKGQLIRRLRAWEARTYVRGLPFHAKSLTSIFGELVKVLFLYKITMEWAFMRIDRSNLTLDASLMYLFRHANYIKLTEIYFKQAQRRQLRKMVNKDEVLNQLTGLSMALSELPGRLYEDIVLFAGPITRRHAMLFQGRTTKFSYFFSVLCGRLAIVFAFMDIILMLAILDHFFHDRFGWLTHGRFAAVIDVAPGLREVRWFWIALFIMIGYFYATFARLQRRFAQKEPPQERERQAV